MPLTPSGRFNPPRFRGNATFFNALDLHLAVALALVVRYHPVGLDVKSFVITAAIFVIAVLMFKGFGRLNKLMKDINNMWPPIIAVAVLSSALTAAVGQLSGTTQSIDGFVPTLVWQCLEWSVMFLLALCIFITTRPPAKQSVTTRPVPAAAETPRHDQLLSTKVDPAREGGSASRCPGEVVGVG
jgi:hypothetical protein